MAEEFVHANHTPQDGAVEVNPGYRAGETINSFRSAETSDICKHPVEHADLGEGRYERGNNLNGEHDTRRDLHIVAQLQIRSKLNALRGRDVSIGDEYHIGDWTAWEDCATDELAYEINGGVLIRDGHDDAIWDEEDAANG